MDVNQLTVPRDEALRMWQKYKSHQHNQTKVDADIQRIYEALANGKVVINAIQSIITAGLNAERLPKLAIARADAKTCWLETYHNGGALMTSDIRNISSRTQASRYQKFGEASFPGIHTGRWNCKAPVPHIPPDIRPKRGLANYHVLWEVEEWQMVPPIDPLLLRRVGREGDIWLVCAAWDLTPVERAVMATHLRS